MDKVNKPKNVAIVLGLVLVGLGVVLYFSAFQLSLAVIELVIGIVIIGLILSKTSQIPNINWKSYFIDLNSEGGKLYLIGLVSGLSGAGLGLTFLATGTLDPLGLLISVALFLCGLSLVVVGSIMAWTERISKWKNVQKSQSEQEQG